MIGTKNAKSIKEILREFKSEIIIFIYENQDHNKVRKATALEMTIVYPRKCNDSKMLQKYLQITEKKTISSTEKRVKDVGFQLFI